MKNVEGDGLPEFSDLCVLCYFWAVLSFGETLFFRLEARFLRSHSFYWSLISSTNLPPPEGPRFHSSLLPGLAWSWRLSRQDFAYEKMEMMWDSGNDVGHCGTHDPSELLLLLLLLLSLSLSLLLLKKNNYFTKFHHIFSPMINDGSGQ